MIPTRIFRSLSNLKQVKHLHTTGCWLDSNSKSEGDGDSKTASKKSNPTKKSSKKLFKNSASEEEKKKAMERLNSLLSEMRAEKNFEGEKSSIHVTKAAKRPPWKERMLRKDGYFGRKVYESVKEVADSFGGSDKFRDRTREELYSSFGTFTKEKKFPRGREEFQAKSQGERASLDMISESKGLGIFKPEEIEKEGTTGVQLMIWDQLQAEELRMKSKAPPRNWFEEQIHWTERGRLWHFPIDNDQGREEEAVDFTEHVFLDEHLEPWCPQRGPIRKFMELVLVGLSRNYHLTVEEKKEHIFWFRDYFETKRKLLLELGAFAPKEISESNAAKPSE